MLAKIAGWLGYVPAARLYHSDVMLQVVLKKLEEVVAKNEELAEAKRTQYRQEILTASRSLN